MRSRTSALLLALCSLLAFPVYAADYLPDLLRNPVYLASWNKLIASKVHGEPWLNRYSDRLDGPSVPSARVALSDGTYTITWVCQAHNCGPRQFVVLFAPDGKAAWGVLLKDTQEAAVLGAPNDERLSAIRKYIREDR
jgi:hypothetical protein